MTKQQNLDGSQKLLLKLTASFKGQSSNIIQKVIHYSKRNLLWNKKYYIVHKENRDVMQNEIYYAKRNKHAKVSKEKSTV